MKILTLVLVFTLSIGLSWSQNKLFNLESSEVFWIAYKYTNKVGVSGTFNKIEINTSKRQLPENILKKMTFNIVTKSVNSNNVLRDGRIYNAFFKTMKKGDNIVGEIYNVRHNQAVVKITLNQISKNIPLTYVVSGNKIELNLTLDFKDFKGERSIAALNKECKGGHTGEDGISLLWPTVDIKAILNLKEVN